MKTMRRIDVLSAMLLFLPTCVLPQSRPRHDWHTATASQLEAVLPMRAPVEKERIETEMHSATGIIDAHGKVIAAVVLITAGYAANGKYSHYLLTQSTLRLGTDILLPPGAYVIGWTRAANGLFVHVYEAATGAERGALTAPIMPPPTKVVPIRMWPPSEGSFIQIGRFMLPYTPVD